MSEISLWCMCIVKGYNVTKSLWPKYPVKEGVRPLEGLPSDHGPLYEDKGRKNLHQYPAKGTLTE